MKIISKLLCDPSDVKILSFSVSTVEIIFSDSTYVQKDSAVVFLFFYIRKNSVET